MWTGEEEAAQKSTESPHEARRQVHGAVGGNVRDGGRGIGVGGRAEQARAAPASDGVRGGLEQMVSDGFPRAIAYSRNGDQAAGTAVGLADTRSGESAEADHRFRIASNTKSFVSTVVLPLEGEGRLSLDDSVEKWLPGVVE